MSKGNTFENEILALIFNGTTIADLAENDSSSPATVLEVSLHTAEPGEGGTQETSEATYTGYARIPVNRNSGGWTVAVNEASNAIAVTFPACSGGTNTITHVGVGLAHSGAGKLLYYGELGTPLDVSTGIIPTFPIGDLLIRED